MNENISYGAVRSIRTLIQLIGGVCHYSDKFHLLIKFTTSPFTSFNEEVPSTAERESPSNCKIALRCSDLFETSKVNDLVYRIIALHQDKNPFHKK